MEVKYKISDQVRVITNEELKKVALVNPVMHRFVVLELNVFNIIEKNLEAVNNLDNKIFDTFSFLKEKKFIVEKNDKASPLYSFPQKFTYAIFELTNLCNLRCITCYNDSKPENKNILTTKEIFYILKKLKTYGIKNIGIGGGEPFIRSDIIEILKFCKENFEQISISTNGTLLTEKICRKIKEYEPTLIQVSIDGFTPEINDLIRGEGSWEKSIKGLLNLKKAGCNNILVKPTLTKLNYKQIGQTMFDFAEKYGVKVAWSKFVPIGRGERNMDKLILPVSEYREFLGGAYKERIECISEEEAKSYVDRYFEIHKFYPALYYCGAGTTSFLIKPNGDVYPCILLEDKKFFLGNILVNDIESFENKFVIPSVDFFTSCAKCDVRYFCCGSCRAEAYYKTGNFLAPNPSCSIYKESYQKILWYYDKRKLLEGSYKKILLELCLS
ncbi:MAG: hypothetical protein DRP84_08145 [Spirochaetes bacterium]|nr:MAG: hypothetical protein DRP84_08145 [Spirochaetota bacterium]